MYEDDPHRRRRPSRTRVNRPPGAPREDLDARAERARWLASVLGDLRKLQAIGLSMAEHMERNGRATGNSGVASILRSVEQTAAMEKKLMRDNADVLEEALALLTPGTARGPTRARPGLSRKAMADILANLQFDPARPN